MRPWFRGFHGEFEFKDDDKTSYTVKGRFEVTKEKLIISELPIRVWTSNYKTFLEDLAQKDIITDIKEFHKDNTIRFELTVPGIYNKREDEILKEFKLTSSLSCNNFVLFDRDYKIKKYSNEVDIMEEFYEYRLEMYDKRKSNMLKRLG